jgi:hypothetical protein
MIDRLRRLLIKRGPESDPRPTRGRRRPQLVVLQGGLCDRDSSPLPPSGRPAGKAA